MVERLRKAESRRALDAAARERIREIAAEYEKVSSSGDRRSQFMVGVPEAPGLLVLFSGPSGTGKTLASTLLCKELGMALRPVDLSQLLGKYIGETEKKLDKLLATAARSDAILFFDEADALFGKQARANRSTDGYANQQVSYLFDWFASHPTVVILSTDSPVDVDDPALDHPAIRVVRFTSDVVI